MAKVNLNQGSSGKPGDTPEHTRAKGWVTIELTRLWAGGIITLFLIGVYCVGQAYCWKDAHDVVILISAVVGNVLAGARSHKESD